MRKPKILTLDIETAPLQVYNWSLWQDSTSVNMIHTEWQILAVCAKWLGKPPMYGDMRKHTTDGELLAWLWLLLDEADIVITQNGKSFDIKKINARLIAEGFGNEMRKYNIQDVAATEKLYLKMRPWIEGHPNLATYDASGLKTQCPKCGSDHLQRRGTYVTQTGSYARMHCQSCGGWSRARKTELPSVRNKLLLTN